jgi:hypothetical protein
MQIKLRPHQERGDVAMQQYNQRSTNLPDWWWEDTEYDYGCGATVSVCNSTDSCCCCSQNTFSRAVVQ